MTRVRSSLVKASDLPESCPALLGSSPAARRARQTVQIAARSTATVLISREAGCLGERVARAIHNASAWADSPFVSIECGGGNAAALVSSLAEDPRRVIDAAGASRATVFLDRLDRVPPPAQEKLAESFSVGRFGTGDSGVRLLGGAQVDLRAMVAEGAFRQDVYYYLAVLVVEIPPLRERPVDVADLLSRFLQDLCISLQRPMPEVHQRVVELCQRYSWPGNIRELHCVAERLLASSTTTSKVYPAALPDEIRLPAPRHPRAPSFQLPPGGLNLGQLERHLIQQALVQQRGNRTHAARMLGLSRQTLLYRMQKHGLR